MNLQQELNDLHKKEKELLSRIEKQRANKTFPCICGKRHKFKNCDVIQQHYYVPPSGCSDGAYWSPTDLYIICPDTDNKNRLYFSTADVPYICRCEYDWNLNEQFKQKYKHLFKSVIDDYEQDTRQWENNDYIQKNYKKYDLQLGPKK